jgi:hypothetical protein
MTRKWFSPRNSLVALPKAQLLLVLYIPNPATLEGGEAASIGNRYAPVKVTVNPSVGL